MFFRNKLAYAIGKVSSEILKSIWQTFNCAETFPGIGIEKKKCMWSPFLSPYFLLPHRQSHPHKPRKQPDHVTHTFIQVNDSAQGQGLGCVQRWRIFNVTGGAGFEPSADSKEFLLWAPAFIFRIKLP